MSDRGRRPGDEARVRHMLDAARRAVELSGGKDVSSLDPSNETALALARLLEILGEAASRVTLDVRERYPEVPWRDIADARNRVIHEYFDVDMEVVEAIVRDDLPLLVEWLESVLDGLDETQGREGG